MADEYDDQVTADDDQQPYQVADAGPPPDQQPDQQPYQVADAGPPPDQQSSQPGQTGWTVEPWTPPADQQQPQAAQPQQEAQGQQGWTIEPYVAPEGQGATFAREAAHGVLPAMGAAGAAMWGAGVGQALIPIPGVGALIGGIGGALVGGYLTESAQDKALKAAGIDDDAQREANRQAAPWTSAAGGGAANLAGFGPGIIRKAGTEAISYGSHLLSGAFSGAGEAAGQYYQGHSLSEAIPPVLAQTAMGTIAAKPYSWGERAGAAGERAGARLTGRSVEATPGQTAPNDTAPPPPEQGSFGFGAKPYDAPYDVRGADQPRPGIGGGERQASLFPEEAPPEPTRAGATQQPELPIEQPVINAEGQYGFNITAPHVGSRNAMPDTGGVAKEAAPPAGAQSTADASYVKERDARYAKEREPGFPAVPDNARPKEPQDKPHSAVSQGYAAEAAGRRSDNGINVLQPGQLDPTIRAGVQPPARDPTAIPREPAGPRYASNESQGLPGGSPEIPRERAVVPYQSPRTQATMEPPVPDGHTRMYQGEKHPPNVFTNDRQAAGPGPVRAVDVPNRHWPFFKATNEANTYKATHNQYQRGLRPLEQMTTEPVHRPGTPPLEERSPPSGSKPSTPDIDAAVAKATGQPPAPPPAPPPPPPKAAAAAATSKGKKPKLVKTIPFWSPKSEGRMKVIGQSTVRDAFSAITFKEGTPLKALLDHVRDKVLENAGHVPIYTVPHSELVRHQEGDAGGFYDPNFKHVVISDKTAMDPSFVGRAVFHEGIHAATSNAIYQNPKLHDTIKRVMDDVIARLKPGEQEKHYGVRDSNVHEFIAEAFSNSRFRKLLSEHMLSPEVARGMSNWTKNPVKSAWDAIVGTVRQVLGLPKEATSALEAAMRLTEHAMNINQRAVHGLKGEVPDYKSLVSQPEWDSPSKKFLVWERTPHGTIAAQSFDKHAEAWAFHDQKNDGVLGPKSYKDVAIESPKAGEAAESEISLTKPIGREEPQPAGRRESPGITRDEMANRIPVAPTGKPQVIARNRGGEEAKFFGATVQEAAANAKNGGYRDHQIFNADGSPYRPPKAEAAAATSKAAGATPPKAEAAAATSKAAEPAPDLQPATKQDLQTGLYASVRRGLGNVFTAGSESIRKSAAAYTAAAGPLARLREQSAFRISNEMHATGHKMDKPGFEKFVDAYEAGGVSALPKEQQPLGNVLKDIYGAFGTEIGKQPRAEQFEAINNYLTHMYKNPKAEIEKFTNDWMGAGGGSLRKRAYPTFAEARAKGLEPYSYNPIEHALRYSEGISHYLTQQRWMTNLEDQKLLGYFKLKNVGASGAPEPLVRGAKGSDEPPAGYAEIKAPWAQKNGKQAYAPADIAQTINQFYDAGLQRVLSKDVHQFLQQTKNMWTAVELGASGYHAMTVGVESFASGISSAMHLAASGRYAEATAQLLKAPAEPVLSFLEGRQGRKVYRDTTDTAGTPLQRKIIDYFTQANIQPGNLRGTADFKRAGEYDMHKLGNYWDAYKRGTLWSEFHDQLKSVSDSYGVKLPAVLLSNIRRSMQTISKPLFEHYIPELKLGTMMKQMEHWLGSNPNATDAQAIAYARKISNSVDNRMGEMNYDNIFMSKTAKDLALLDLRSFGFTVGGPFREIGAGAGRFVKTATELKNPMKHFDLRSDAADPRVAYAAAYLPAIAAIGAMYQYMRTGKGPDDWRDLITPKTGGMIKSIGKLVPERILPPGYQKDYMGYFVKPLIDPHAHAIDELIAKQAAPWTALWEQLSGKDWTEKPFIPPRATVMENLEARAKQLGTHMLPIGPKQLSEGARPGSKLTYPEQALGVRTPGSYMLNPKGLEGFLTKKDQGDWKSRERQINNRRRDQGLPALPGRRLPPSPYQ